MALSKLYIRENKTTFLVKVLLPFMWINIFPQHSMAQDSQLLLPLTSVKSPLPSVNANDLGNPRNSLSEDPMVPNSSSASVDSPGSSLPDLRDEGFNELGIFMRFTRDGIVLRSSSGAEQKYPFSAHISSIPPLKPGLLVSYRLKSKTIEKMTLPAVKDVFEGTLIVIEDDVLGILSKTGERKIARLSEEKITSLELILGQTIQIVYFEDVRAKVIHLLDHSSAPIYIP